MEYLESEVIELLKQQRDNIITEVTRAIRFQNVPKYSQDKVIQAIEQTPEPELKE